jgi:hypothetical protein
MLAQGRLNYVTRDRCRMGATLYDLTVYQLWRRFFAAWRCERCGKKGRGRLRIDHFDAYEDGVAAITEHSEQHLGARATRHISCKMFSHTSHGSRP